LQGARVRVCRVHRWHTALPSMLAGPLVPSKLALGENQAAWNGKMNSVGRRALE
jgi:hypothetical protein